MTRKRVLTIQSPDRPRSIFVSLSLTGDQRKGKSVGGKPFIRLKQRENMHVREHATRFKQAVEAVEHGAMLRPEPQEDQCGWNQGTASPARLGAIRVALVSQQNSLLDNYPIRGRAELVGEKVVRKIGRVPTFSDLGMRRASGPLQPCLSVSVGMAGK